MFQQNLNKLLVYIVTYTSSLESITKDIVAAVLLCSQTQLSNRDYENIQDFWSSQSLSIVMKSVYTQNVTNLSYTTSKGCILF